MKQSFGELIYQYRINNGSYTLRAFYKKLVLHGLKMSISEYSKIERGIQNPRCKNEFEIIIKTLGITDNLIISELERLALSKIEKKNENLESFPVFLPSNINDDKKIDKLIDFFKESDKPDW